MRPLRSTVKTQHGAACGRHSSDSDTTGVPGPPHESWFGSSSRNSSAGRSSSSSCAAPRSGAFGGPWPANQGVPGSSSPRPVRSGTRERRCAHHRFSHFTTSALNTRDSSSAPLRRERRHDQDGRWHPFLYGHCTGHRAQHHDQAARIVVHNTPPHSRRSPHRRPLRRGQQICRKGFRQVF